MTTLMPGHAPLKFTPMANLFPMLSDKELDELGQDIKANGQVETVKLFKGAVLDGRNRYTACVKLGLPVRTEVFQGTDREALDWVISKNLKRRHLTERDRLKIAASIAKIKLGDNQHTREQAAPIGAPALDFGTQAEAPAVAPAEEGAPMSQSDRADKMQVSHRSLQRADILYEKGAEALQQAFESGKVAVSTAAEIAEALPAEEQKQVAAMSEADILAKAKEIRKDKNDKRRAERSGRIREIAEASKDLPTGQKFPLIYMDPPTKYAAGDSDRSTENHYPTMTEDQIAALPVADLALDDCVLFIWTTVPWLRKTMRLIESWGFEFKSATFWDKEHFGTGFWWQNQVEVLIGASRGNPVIAENGSIMGPGIYREKKERHSAKPEYFRQMIDAVPEWKDWPKVELFPRGELPGNWKGWGNEARLTKQQALGLEGEAA